MDESQESLTLDVDKTHTWRITVETKRIPSLKLTAKAPENH